MKNQKYKIAKSSTTDNNGEFDDLFSLKYAPHSRIFSNEQNEKLILVYFLSHANTKIDENITFLKDPLGFQIVISTTEPESNKGDVIAVQIIIKCDNYNEVVTQIDKKETILIGINNTINNSITSDYRYGGLSTDPIPEYPPIHGLIK